MGPYRDEAAGSGAAGEKAAGRGAEAARLDRAVARSSGDAGKPPATPTGSPPYYCDRCGTIMLDLHCKLVCERCGYKRDCSDP